MMRTENDKYHAVMNRKPNELTATTHPRMNKWIGQVTCAYGMVAQDFDDYKAISKQRIEKLQEKERQLKEENKRLKQDNQKLKLFENLLREIYNADMGINIEIETGLWTCDYCNKEFNEDMFRYFVPMDWVCLQEYKKNKEKLSAIREIVKPVNTYEMEPIPIILKIREVLGDE